MNILRFKFLTIVLLLLGNCNQTPVEENEIKDFELLWQFEYQKEIASLSSVANAPTIVDEGRVLLGIDYGVTLITTENGQALWRYDLPEGSRIGTRNISYDNQYSYIKHDSKNTAVALSLESGVKSWELTIDQGSFFDSRADIISENSVFFVGTDQKLHEVSKNGLLKNVLQLNYTVRSGHYTSGDLIIAHAYRDADLSPYAFGQIVRYDLKADSIKWKYETDTGGYYYAPILLVNNIIYTGTTSGPSEFVAINANTGEVLWRTLDLDSWAYTLGEKSIYINEGADLVALDKKTGRQMWRTKFPGGGYDSSNVAYMDGYVYHSHSGSFFVLDAITGEIVYSTVLPDRSYAGNVSAGFGKVFVQSDYHLFCYKGWEAE